MKKMFVFGLLATTLAVCTLPSAALADSPAAMKEKVDIGKVGSVPESELNDLRAHALKISPSTKNAIISPEVTKSPNYAWPDLRVGDSWSNGSFTITQTEDVLVTLVQWPSYGSGTAGLFYVMDPVSGGSAKAVWVSGNWTSQNTTVTIPGVTPGTYTMKIVNDGNVTATGNFFVYY